MKRRVFFLAFLGKSEEKTDERTRIYVNGLRCFDYWRRSRRKGCGLFGGPSWLRNPVDRKRKAGRHFLSQRLLCDSGLADVRPVVSGKWVFGEESGEYGYRLWVYYPGLVRLEQGTSGRDGRVSEGVGRGAGQERDPGKDWERQIPGQSHCRDFVLGRCI